MPRQKFCRDGQIISRRKKFSSGPKGFAVIKPGSVWNRFSDIWLGKKMYAIEKES